jgi:outer membrane protein OmpA-like peptidoglycan-associated protein
MTKVHLYVIFFIMFIQGNLILGQTLHTNSNKALKSYNDGKMAYDFMDFRNAEVYLKESIRIDKDFYEAYMVLGELMSKLSRFSESSAYYRQAVRIDSLFYKPVFFPLANAEKMSGDYSLALVHYNVYLKQPGISEKNKNLAIKSIKDCQFAVEAIKNPVPFSPVNLGDSINTADDEYWPSITVDGSTFMFTRLITTGRANPRNQEDFYFSRLTNGNWGKAYNAGFPLNTISNEGAQSLSSDGRYMYFTACERPDGMGRCDIYYSEFDGVNWSLPVNVGPPVNSTGWESQPSISANGQMLFFASNRAGGIGGMDLWYSVLGANGSWKQPVNLGPIINTTGDEMSPFIHFDGHTLYFSSSGREGMGGYDIFYSRMKNDSTWTEPKNLGFPINTFNDELGLIIDAKGQVAYFSSKRDAGKGKDIYSFSVYDGIKPDPVSYFKGTVYDKLTGKKLRANYELIDLKSGKTILTSQTDVRGSFLVCLPPDNNYGLNVDKEGYLFYSDNFMLEGVHSASEPFIKNIELSQIQVGEKLTLSNVFYEFDSWKITPESFPELNKLAKLLTDNKSLKVEIGGFTDAIGTNVYNLELSEKRAKSVRDYLVTSGINSARLTYKGFGSSSPLGDNITGDGRKLNRRTEIKITGK